MNRSICIILVVNSNLKLIQKTLKSLENIEFVNDLYVLSNCYSIKEIEKFYNKKILNFIPKLEIKKFSNIVEGINICLRKTNSSYSLILNEGHYLDNTVLAKLLNIFSEDKNTRIIYTNSILTNKKDNFLSYYPADNLEKFFKPNSNLKPIIDSSVIFNNNIFKENGFFDINLKYHFIFEYINRCLNSNKNYSEKNNYVRYEQNFLSYKQLDSSLVIDGFNHYEKAIEFFDIYNKLNKTNTGYIEKRFLQLTNKKNQKKILQEISKIKISINTKDKIDSLFRKINEDKKNYQDFKVLDDKPLQLKLLLYTRPDLKNLNFHLKEKERNFCDWLVNHGFNEYPDLLNYSDNKEVIDWLYSKNDQENFGIIDDKPLQLQVLLNTRPDLKNLNFHLREKERNFCHWLFNHGFNEYPNLLNYSDNKEVIDWLYSKNDRDYISRINRARLDSNVVLQKIFKTKIGIKLFDFYKNLFTNFLPLKLKIFKKYFYFYFLKFFKLRLKVLINSRNGVNLIGYAKHALGIGEDLRSTAYALNSMKLKTAIINFNPGSLDKSREENTLENRIQTKHLYNTTILCLTAEETLRFILTKGINNLKGKYVIGYWPWELPNWPKTWIFAFDFVNEIWVSSNHIRESLGKLTNKPVKVMPLCVDQEGYKISQQSLELRLDNRKNFNLNLNSIYICYSFDQSSYINRKNPLDALRSFQMAFPPYPSNLVNNNVRLLIKTFKTQNPSWEWQFLKEMSNFDPRVEIVEKNMSRIELLNFYGCCDIFLSLHRAEGYGRNLAEALQLGLDLIATDWSGNKDYCKGDLYHPVSYKLIPLKPLEYPHWPGQFWAEPDISSSAKILKKVVHKRMNEGLPNKEISKKYQRYFSATKCGDKYIKRLSNLGLINDIRT